MPSNPFDIVRTFEKVMAEYTGAPKAVAVDSGTAALFLCFQRLYKLRCNWFEFDQPQNQAEPINFVLSIPNRTFVSVPMMAIHANAGIKWRYSEWHGAYPISMVSKKQKMPLIWDSALRLRKDLFKEFAPIAADAPAFRPVTYVCLSFQYRKHLPIGRGGMILHNDDDEVDTWFRRMRFFGRSEVPVAEDPGPTVLGWRYYMTPTDAARGLSFMQHMSDNDSDLAVEYPDLSNYDIFKPYTFLGEPLNSL